MTSKPKLSDIPLRSSLPNFHVFLLYSADVSLQPHKKKDNLEYKPSCPNGYSPSVSTHLTTTPLTTTKDGFVNETYFIVEINTTNHILKEPCTTQIRYL